MLRLTECPLTEALWLAALGQMLEVTPREPDIPNEGIYLKS